MGDRLCGDIDVMSVAMADDGSAARWARPPLSCTDLRLFRAADLIAEQMSASNQTVGHSADCKKDLIMSVRFAFARKASPAATQAHQKIKADKRFSMFHLYDPNVISKGFCGWKIRDITKKTYPCRGKCRLQHLFKVLLTSCCSELISRSDLQGMLCSNRPC